ncbi:hypothetical protein GCM10023194_60530 [Planotetraspora phitsanulokensis]|uniref:Uncharacterized protein n=1 Tax=Planotetraspora phitsanulokensis TaxID=575192 RepID=A0A8J3U5W7_9ACTN|nr:hypothetical protein [Planotetraspora phitsanulokensis]GII37726.1 hypothetical protein Pph01_27290 [Planotetraspora phitsanulokensis]
MLVSDLLKLVGKLLLVFIGFVLVFVALAGEMGSVELGIWTLLLVAALVLTVLQDSRSRATRNSR